LIDIKCISEVGKTGYGAVRENLGQSACNSRVWYGGGMRSYECHLIVYCA